MTGKERELELEADGYAEAVRLRDAVYAEEPDGDEAGWVRAHRASVCSGYTFVGSLRYSQWGARKTEKSSKEVLSHR